MFNFIINKFKKKKARRITDEYPFRVDDFQLQKEGHIQFANWLNPLTKLKKITQSEIDFYKKFINKGDLVIDIGSNIGDTTVPMALAAGAEGLTLAFDPNPYVFKILEANVKLNSGKVNIRPYPYAITDKESDFFYRSSEASFANGGIKETDEDFHGKFSLGVKIKGVRLVDILDKHASYLNKLSFVKVDAEGLDATILKSFADVVKQYKPVVVAECFTRLSPEDRYDLFNTVALPGYKVYKFEDFEDDTEIIQITSKEGMTKWKTFNVVAVHDERNFVV